jgi:hypothetical protein
MSLGLIRRPMRLRTSVASVAPEAAPWYRRATRAEAREMAAPRRARWSRAGRTGRCRPSSTLAAATPSQPFRCGPRRSTARRRPGRRVCRARRRPARHRAAAEPAVRQVDVIRALVSAIGRRRDFPHLAGSERHRSARPAHGVALVARSTAAASKGTRPPFDPAVHGRARLVHRSSPAHGVCGRSAGDHVQRRSRSVFGRPSGGAPPARVLLAGHRCVAGMAQRGRWRSRMT